MPSSRTTLQNVSIALIAVLEAAVRGLDLISVSLFADYPALGAAASILLQSLPQPPVIAAALTGLFFFVLYYLFIPSIFPSTMQGVTEDPVFRTLGALAALSVSFPYYAELQLVIGFLTVKDGWVLLFVFVGILLFYLERTSEDAVGHPETTENIPLRWVTPEEDMEDSKDLFTQKDRSPGQYVSIALHYGALYASYLLPFMFLGFLGVILNSFYPLLELLMLALALDGLVERVFDISLQETLAVAVITDVEDTFYRDISITARSLKGRYMLAVVVLGTILTIGQYLMVTRGATAFGLASRELLNAFIDLLAAPSFDAGIWLWKNVSEYTGLYIGTFFVLLYWYRTVQRLPTAAKAWHEKHDIQWSGGHTTEDAPPRRPDGLLLTGLGLYSLAFVNQTYYSELLHLLHPFLWLLLAAGACVSILTAFRREPQPRDTDTHALLIAVLVQASVLSFLVATVGLWDFVTAIVSSALFMTLAFFSPDISARYGNDLAIPLYSVLAAAGIAGLGIRSDTTVLIPVAILFPPVAYLGWKWLSSKGY